MLKLSEAAQLAGGACYGADVEFNAVSTDSRSIGAGDLFVALQGPRFDGSAYAAQAQAAGAVAALVSRPPAADMPYILVGDTRAALGRLAAGWRRRLNLKLAGVTGSNGKTTVKEMLAAIVAEAGPAGMTRGNLNNDIGVPLTLLALRPEHRFAVVEMGANHPGEIAALAAMARPDVAVLNNAGAAHLEGFGSLEGVARAKGELITALDASGAAVLNTDDPFCPLWRELAGARRVLAFGCAPEAQVRLSADSYRCHTEPENAGLFYATFTLGWDGREWPIRLALPGRHNALNAAAAAAAALALGLDGAQIGAGLAKVQPVRGRMQPVRCSGGALLFNDSYNANPSSLSVGLEVLSAAPGEHWLALGGFGELGETAAALHAEVGREAKARGVKRLFATGPWAERAVAAFGSGGEYFDDFEELTRVVRQSLHKDVAMLIKGSRSQRMERLVDALCRTEGA